MPTAELLATPPLLDAFSQAIARCSVSPPSNGPRVEPPVYENGHWKTYPHSAWTSSLLDSPETNPQIAENGSTWGSGQETPSAAVAFRHSGWRRQRRLVREALDSLDTPPRPLARFDACGSSPWVFVDESDPTRLAIHSNHCHSRWCTPCSRERAHRLIGNLRVKLNDGDVRFLTLTMKHSDAPLRDQIDRIYDSFRKLRRAPFWVDAVDAGCAILEVKHSHRTGLWHVHIHCLVHGTWVDGAALKAEWWRITGDSYIVDVRNCGDADHAAHYVAKYITKPVPNSVINKPVQLCEMIAAFQGRRLVLTWGGWRGVRLSEPLDATAWKAVSSLTELYQRKAAGDLDAYVVLSRLEQVIPEAPILAGRSPPPTEADPIGHLF